jgi:predicted naringenin-chalcone synthase
LLCAVELCSLHYCFQWNQDRFLGNVLFADGAGALVLGTQSSGHWQVDATGSCLLPDCPDAMQWKLGDHGFEMSISAQVPELIARHLREWMDVWLDANRLTLADIKSWAVHPGGPRILTAVEESLGLPTTATAASRAVLSEFGNMSSPTVLFVLERLQMHNAARPCVALGFGPGLTVEAALLR